VIIALLALLALAACERSASTQVLPTPTEISGAGGGDGGVPSVDPTMDAIGTQLAASATQTVQPGGDIGGGQVVATATPIVAAPTAALTTTVAAPTAAPAAGCTSPYTVKQGDWIYKIARDCKLDPKAIIAANPGINANRLTPGQKINLPGAQPTAVPGAPTPTPAAQACQGTYTVKQGENLFRIAFNCGLTTEQLARLNNIPFPYTIYPGQQIKFP
jgi:LysM repeat protein